jgi:hypothetical protein
VARVTVRRVRHRFRQPGGGYDRNITSTEALRAVVDCIHANPVRRDGWHEVARPEVLRRVCGSAPQLATCSKPDGRIFWPACESLIPRPAKAYPVFLRATVLFQETDMVSVLWRRRFAVLVSLLCASVAMGCRRAGETTFDVLDGVKYKILVEPGAANFSSSKTTEESGQEVFRWDNGNLKIELKVKRAKGPADSFSSKLKVNERDYGTLKPGDSVIIDARGAVKIIVNGMERIP